MQSLQIFDFNDNMVRTLKTDDGEVLFRASDVAAVLGLDTHAMLRMVDDDDRTFDPVIDSLGRPQMAAFLLEAGFYTVLIRSNKEEAKPFRRWVTREVLPQIRQTGSYMSQQDRARLDRLECLIGALYSRQGKKNKVPEIDSTTNAEKKSLEFIKRMYDKGNKIFTLRQMQRDSRPFQKLCAIKKGLDFLERIADFGALTLSKPRHASVVVEVNDKIKNVEV